MRRDAAIVGIGRTAYRRASGHHAGRAAEASRNALADAGLFPVEVRKERLPRAQHTAVVFAAAGSDACAARRGGTATPVPQLAAVGGDPGWPTGPVSTSLGPVVTDR